MSTRLASLPAVALLLAAPAMATPLALTPGASGLTPAYDGRTPTTTTLLGAKCGFFSGDTCSTGTSLLDLAGTAASILESSGGFIEAAGTTALSPYGSSDVAIAFIFGGAAAPSITGATLSSLTGYFTSVEACGPIFGSQFEGCTGSPGNAARSGGTGDSITFTNFPPTNSFSFLDLHLPYTDGYVIYTDAPVTALTDPDSLSVNFARGSPFEFAGFGLIPPSTGVPEPATLGLLGLGLMGLGLTRRRRRFSLRA